MPARASGASAQTRRRVDRVGRRVQRLGRGTFLDARDGVLRAGASRVREVQDRRRLLQTHGTRRQRDHVDPAGRSRRSRRSHVGDSADHRHSRRRRASRDFARTSLQTASRSPASASGPAADLIRPLSVSWCVHELRRNHASACADCRRTRIVADHAGLLNAADCVCEPRFRLRHRIDD